MDGGLIACGITADLHVEHGDDAVVPILHDHVSGRTATLIPPFSYGG